MQKAGNVYFSLGEHGVAVSQSMEALRKGPSFGFSPFRFGAYAPMTLRMRDDLVFVFIQAMVAGQEICYRR
jgi:hypothetical protein